MDSGLRAAVAFIVGRMAGSTAGQVFDYSTSRHISFSGSVSDDRCAVYDYGRSCQVSGSFPSIYDYGGSGHLQLKVTRKSEQSLSFDGYDYRSSRHFFGHVNGRSVQLYDYQDSRHHQFQV